MSDNRLHTEETNLLPLKIEHKGIVYQDKYKKIERIHAQFQGFLKEYFVSNYGEKAAVIVVKDGHILLARQYRLLINDLSFEIPGGKINKNESPKEAAVRECLEETGVKCEGVELLLNYNPDLEYSRNFTHVFHAQFSEDTVKRDSRHVWQPLRECMRMVFEGTISDSLSIIAILAYANKVEKV